MNSKKISKNEFDKYCSKFLTLDVPMKWAPLRFAAKLASVDEKAKACLNTIIAL